MKQQFIIIILGFLVFFGCDSYLDEAPDNRQDITTLEEIAQLLVPAYSEGVYNFVEWKTDNAVEIIDNTQLPWMTENFSYEPVVSAEDQDTPTNFWRQTYKAIAHSNQALKSLDEVEDTNDEFEKALRGEALITRAYNHFMLANVFCLHYSEENKSTLGIPYIKEPETILQQSYERGTLEGTYNDIEKDLLEALNLVSDEFYQGSGKYHFNTNAALAFASRFYLFKGNYEKCIEYSGKLLNKGQLATYVRNMDETFSGTFDEQSEKFADANITSNLLLVRKESSYTREERGYRADFVTHNTIYNVKPQTGDDFRFSPFGRGTDASFQPKYDELFRFITSTTGFPYFIMPELRSEEVVLNRIESYIRLNRLDEALDDYNQIAPMWYSDGGQLTSTQIMDFYGGTSQEAMLDFVIAERRKEFLNEGLRWFDIKRLKLEVYHIISTDSNRNVLRDVTLSSNDLRKAVQIPESAIINGIQANPR